MIINILVDNPNSWIMPFAQDFSQGLTAQHQVNFVDQQDKLIAGEIAIFLSCEQIVAKENLAKNKHNLVVHASALPQGRGWSPLTWQILEGKNSIPLTLFEAEEKVDRGQIYEQVYVDFEGYELIDELRNKLGAKIIFLVKNFIYNYPNVNGREQTGESSYYKRRLPEQSELDPNRSLAEQFNLFRVADNEKYPVFFHQRGHKYILKIYKVE